MGLWAGAVAVAIGGGPTLTPEQVDYCRGRAKVIAINDAIRLAPWADLLYFADERWYRWHEAEVRAFKGQRATIENRHLAVELPGLWCFENAGVKGLCLRPQGLMTGKNSGYQVINLALHLGVSKLVLIGYDMSAAPGRTHWFGDHPVPGRPDRFAKVHLPMFEGLVDPLKRSGMEVVNATPETALKAFPSVRLEEALA